MVIDTSAIIAILMDESESDIFSKLVASETTLAISAVTFHEASMAAKIKAGQRRRTG